MPRCRVHRDDLMRGIALLRKFGQLHDEGENKAASEGLSSGQTFVFGE